MTRLLQKEKVISALAGFSASDPDAFRWNFIPSWDEVKMWTKLVNVYEARLRCKNHVSAESLANLARLLSADVFDMKKVPKLGTFIAKMVINLNTIFHSHPVRHMPEIHPILGLILSTGIIPKLGIINPKLCCNVRQSSD